MLCLVPGSRGFLLLLLSRKFGVRVRNLWCLYSVLLDRIHAVVVPLAFDLLASLLGLGKKSVQQGTHLGVRSKSNPGR